MASLKVSEEMDEISVQNEKALDIQKVEAAWQEVDVQACDVETAFLHAADANRYAKPPKDVARPGEGRKQLEGKKGMRTGIADTTRLLNKMAKGGSRPEQVEKQEFKVLEEA